LAALLPDPIDILLLHLGQGKAAVFPEGILSSAILNLL
jgi:hypothetical protein